MIQVYRPGTSLDRNGDMVLKPTECTVTTKLNEVWVLEMVHPIDLEGRWGYIMEEGIIKVPTWQNDDQLYRIVSIEKTIDEVRVTAYPIFFDAKHEIFIENFSWIAIAQTALNEMLALGPTDPATEKPLFKAHAYLEPSKVVRFKMRDFFDCLMGAEEPTILGLYGGELRFDNYYLYLEETIGSDRGVYVRYGKNITGIEYTMDFTDIVTRVYPIAYGDHAITSGAKYVDSEHIDSYDIVYAKKVLFDKIRLAEDVPAGESDNYISCNDSYELDSHLREAAAELMANGADKPRINIKIDMVSLLGSDEGSGFTNFERISLGDTVHCIHEKMGLESDTRVISIVWDCIKNRARSIELGQFSYDYLKELYV